ncbi:alkaline phosphatase [Sinomicrobium weinanense]|uniref:Alkaline phosphatase n=1 Tax=Sinomicrobium weinanense TaxID=2842200 RepID=A0A926JUT6_9FLAO|nr:alkaline phosphatase [Sinomicrobium weinanense]MBC9797761.1 alkaline phosphatase [Sinomicrobium weinanense]MBU3122420.1 alkaline phosphatase [Sinomicrobium weinanense]
MRKHFITAALLILSISLNAQIKEVKHVVLVGFDGFGAYAVPKAEMPNLKKMMNEGAHTLKARSVLPSSSAVNWASMLMGAGPTMHGYTEWGSKKPEIPSVTKTEYGLFPSIFSVIRKQKPEARTAVIYSWGGIGYLIEKEAIDDVIPTDDDDEAALRAAIQTITTQKPLFTFVHFDEPDVTGHNIGHDTPEYYAQLKKVDTRLGKIRAAIKEAGMEKETIVIVSADHGGIDKGHGGKTLTEVEILWIIAGPGIAKGKTLENTIITYDTAATIAWILGLKTPQAWRGAVVKEAFNR